MLKIKIYKTTPASSGVLASPEIFVGDYFINNFNASYQVKSSPSFSFQIDFSQFLNFPFVPDTTYSFRLYRDDTEVIVGLVGDVDVDYVAQVVKFTCEDRTFYLSFYPALPLVRWETRNVLAVIDYLFFNVPTIPWRLPVFSGAKSIRDMNNPSQTVFVDTTNDENLLTQLTNILSSIPDAYLVASNEVAPYADRVPQPVTVQEGWEFYVRSYDSTPIFNVYSENIVSLNTNWEQQPAIYRVQCYGAEYDAAGTPAIVDLSNKTVADISGFTSDIVNSYVTNNSLSALDTSFIRSTVKIFDEIKPKTLSSPGANQRQRASNGLYKRAVRFLQDYESNRRYNLKVNQDLTGLEIGNRVYIDQQVSVPHINQATAQVTYYTASNFNIQGIFYVESFRITYESESVSYDLVIVENPSFLARDNEVKAYNAKKDQKLKSYNVEPTVKRHGYFETTIGPGLASNCGGGGRTVTFTKNAGDFGDIIPFVPGVAASDWYWYDIEVLSDLNAVGSRLVSIDPNVAGATFSFCVRVNGNWTTADQVTVRVLVAWT